MRQNHPAPDSAELHRWDVSLRDALEIQKRLRKRLSLKDGFVFGRLRRIAGADVAYAADGKTIFGAVVVLSFPELMIVEESWVKDKVGFPYLPGLLSFREAPILIRACGLLKQRPDLIIFDGQGIAHPRRLGLASHAGLWLDLPSVGCAKSRLVGAHGPLGRKRGASSRLWFKGREVGAALRTRTGVNPLFVSPGHKISVRSSIRVVLAACNGYRLPEPIRRAHQLADRLRAAAGG